MKSINQLIVFILLSFTSIAFSQNVSSKCNDYVENGGIAKNVHNKHWAVEKVYADSIPLPDSLFTDNQYLFVKDGLFYMFKNAKNTEPQANGYDYLINEQDSKIIIKVHNANDIVCEYKVVCLTEGHLAFYYDVPSQEDPLKKIRLEFRFNVNYDWENQIIQTTLKSANQ